MRSKNEILVAETRGNTISPIHFSGLHRPRFTQPQSSSASRDTAECFGFLLSTQCHEWPERQGEPSRFDTMPSKPSLHAWRNTTSPVRRCTIAAHLNPFDCASQAFG